MTEKTIHIDPEKFAYHFVDTVDFSNFNQEEMQRRVKDELFAYLSAYTLAEKFNASEASAFMTHEEKEIDNLSMGSFLKLISQKNNFTPNID